MVNSSVYVVAPLVGFLLFRRIRRTFGSQKLRPNAALVRGVLLTVFLVITSLSVLRSLTFAGAVLGGAASGIALGIVGLRLTRFEFGADGLRYVPNTYLGVALTLALFGRLAYRFAALQASGVFEGRAGAPRPESALTSGMIAAFLAYYATYSWGLWLKSRSMAPDAVASTTER